MLDRYNIVDERDAQTAGEKMARYLEEKAWLAEERPKIKPERLQSKKVRTLDDACDESEADEVLLIQ